MPAVPVKEKTNPFGKLFCRISSQRFHHQYIADALVVKNFGWIIGSQQVE